MTICAVRKARRLATGAVFPMGSLTATMSRRFATIGFPFMLASDLSRVGI